MQEGRPCPERTRCPQSLPATFPRCQLCHLQSIFALKRNEPVKRVRSRGRAAAEPQPAARARSWKGPCWCGEWSVFPPARLTAHRQHTSTPSAENEVVFFSPFPTLPSGPTKAERKPEAPPCPPAGAALQPGVSFSRRPASNAARASEKRRKKNPDFRGKLRATPALGLPGLPPGRTTTFRSLLCGFVCRTAS